MEAIGGQMVTVSDVVPQPQAAWARGPVVAPAGAAACRQPLRVPLAQGKCPQGCTSTTNDLGYCVDPCKDPNCETKASEAAAKAQLR